MRIIFLDVDGVLNCMSTKDDAPCGCIGVDSRKVEVLKKILEESRKEEENKEKISGYDLEKNLKDFYKDKVFAFDYDNKNDSTSNSYRKLIFHTRNNY